MDALDSRFLREFLIVACEGSIRRAAERLNIAPSAISRKLAEVEARLGVALVARSAQGITLTDAGRLVREHALVQQDEQTFLLDQIGKFREAGGQVVRIAVGEGFAADLMQNGLAPLGARHPHLRFRIDLAGTEEIQRRVVEGEVDLGIAYNPVPTEATRSVAFARQPLCAVVPVGSPLAAREHIPLAEMLAEPLAMLDARHGIRTLVARAASDLGLALRPQVETSSIAALIRYVGAGMGGTFLPRFSASIQAERGEVAIVDLDEESLQHVSAHLMVRARRRLPQSAAVTVDYLAAHMVAFRD
ncbi:LysR family transcriptional regulator [Nitratireductor aquimarinus]|uniref:LysR family transcriptional regulator n=1 Tax=Nitratireductor aquimarinus TaxID=889300 RepID=UPI001A8C4F81|nr:LysR family transcriptional regulator [Nitratireductor aquimarinus]MBN8243535.1 LysR family transcriptional regulator [Nitratireductor aquimarinus]MBY6132252.1 LysR family transcriptional regulator [Nitratireductor aquimarinus]MCA1303251.1 LysR family transcriptional regulator [Nitratireductor aquimarinus]